MLQLEIVVSEREPQARVARIVGETVRDQERASDVLAAIVPHLPALTRAARDAFRGARIARERLPLAAARERLALIGRTKPGASTVRPRVAMRSTPLTPKTAAEPALGRE